MKQISALTVYLVAFVCGTMLLVIGGPVYATDWDEALDPWPRGLPRVSTAAVQYWGTYYYAGNRSHTKINITLEVADVMTVYGEVEEWIYSHGGRNTSRQKGEGNSYVEFVDEIELKKIAEITDWIRTRGKVIDDRISSESSATFNKTQVEDRLKELDREFVENRSAWKRMPIAASLVGEVWASNKTMNRLQLENAQRAELTVRIRHAGRNP